MRRYLYLSLLTLALAFWPARALATDMTIQAETIPYWGYSTDPAYLEIVVDRAFTATDLITYQPAGTGGGWRLRVPVTVTPVTGTGGVVLYKQVSIEMFHIQSTTDAPIGTKDARYSAYFVDARGRRIAPYAGFESFRIPASFANGIPTQGTWADVRTFNIGPMMPQYDLSYYSREETNRLISQAVLSAGGVTTINGINTSTQTFAAGTNISITTLVDTHTIALTGQVGVANGGTGAASAAAARTNLGAAASGANTDITSLAGLTTALGVQYGGTGFLGGYTAGDLIYATGATTLARRGIGSANNVLVVSGGAPTWSSTLSVSSMTTATATVTGLTTGRVPFVGPSDVLSDDSLLLWDEANNRLSVATTLSSEAINLPLDGYVGGTTIGGATISKLLGTRTVNRVTGMSGGAYTTTNDTGADLAPNLIVAQRWTDGGASDVNPIGPPYQVGISGIRVTRGLGGSYNESSVSNVFANATTVRNIGSSPTVAVFGEGLATGTNSQVWGGNFVAYVDTAAALTNASAKGVEINYGFIDSNGGAPPSGGGALGLLIVSTGFKNTDAHIIMQAGAANTAPSYGILFNTAIGRNPITDTGVFMSVSGGSKYPATRGVDMAGATYTAGAFNASSSNVTSGYRINDASDTMGINVAALIQSTSYGSNVLQYGSALTSGTAIDGILFNLTGDGETGEAVRIDGEGVGIGMAGVSLAHRLAIRPHHTRTLSGTVATNSGSATVSGSSTLFTEEVRPGSPITIGGVTYEVETIVSDTSLTLTTNASATLIGQTATADSPAFSVETSEGVDLLEVDANGSLVLYDDAPQEFGAPAAYTDYEGALQIRSRTTPAKRFIIGYDDASDAVHLSSILSEPTAGNLAWGNIIINAGGGDGRVGIGTAFPTAALTVAGSGAKTADFIGSQFDNVATSAAAFTKVGAAFNITTLAGEWVGAARGIQVDVTNARDTGYNRTGYPAVLHGGGVLIAPPQSTGPIFSPEAMLDVYGYRQTQIAGSDVDANTVTTTGTTQVNAAGAVTFASLEPGQAISFGTETAAYEIDYFSNTTPSGTLFLTSTKSAATFNQAYVDPPLLRLRNGAGTDRLVVTSGGRATFGGPVAFAGSPTAMAVPGDGVISLRTADLGGLNAFNKSKTILHVGADADTLETINGGEDGQLLILVFEGAVTVSDGAGNIELSAAGAFDLNDTLTLIYNESLGLWLEVARATN